MRVLVDIASLCCFFEFLRHFFGAGIADGDEHLVVGSHCWKSLFAVLRHRTAMSFASKLSSVSLPPDMKAGALSECVRAMFA